MAQKLTCQIRTHETQARGWFPVLGQPGLQLKTLSLSLRQGLSHYIAQVGLKLTRIYLPVSASHSAGIKGWATTPDKNLSKHQNELSMPDTLGLSDSVGRRFQHEAISKHKLDKILTSRKVRAGQGPG